MSKVLTVAKDPVFAINSDLTRRVFTNVMGKKNIIEKHSIELVKGAIKDEMNRWSRAGFTKNEKPGVYMAPDFKSEEELVTVVLKELPGSHDLGWGITANEYSVPYGDGINYQITDDGDFTIRSGSLAPSNITHVGDDTENNYSEITPLNVDTIIKTSKFILDMSESMAKSPPIVKSSVNKISKDITNELEKTLNSDNYENSDYIENGKILLKTLVRFIAMRHNVYSELYKRVNRSNQVYLDYCKKSIDTYK